MISLVFPSTHRKRLPNGGWDRACGRPPKLLQSGPAHDAVEARRSPGARAHIASTFASDRPSTFTGQPRPPSSGLRKGRVPRPFLGTLLVSV